MTDPPARSYVLGRGKGCDVDLADGSVSRKHATLCIGGDGALHLSDFPSRLGTFVYRGGAWQRIEASAIEPNEPVMFGEHRTTPKQLIELIRRRMSGMTTDDN